MEQQDFLYHPQDVQKQQYAINFFQNLLDDKQLFIILYEKHDFDFSKMSQISYTQANIAYCHYAQNLFIKSIYFLQKWIQDSSKKIKELTFEKVQKIVHLLISNSQSLPSSLNSLKQKLIHIMKYLYLKQPISYQFLEETADILKIVVNQCNHLYKSKFTISSELITFSRPQISFYKQQTAQQQQEQPQEDSFTKLIKNPTAQNMLKVPTKKKAAYEQDWHPHQLKKAIELYLNTDHNQFSSIAFELGLYFKNRRKFAQSKVVSKLNTAMRTGLTILRQYTTKHNLNKTGKQIIVNTHISKVILQCRSTIITHQVKKSILQLNIKTDFSEQFITNLLEKVIQFMYKNF